MDVNIQIKTVQSALDDPGVTPETVETNAVGTYRRDDEGDKLCYDEPEESGLGKCRTTVVVASDGVVTVRRSGKTRSQMVLECGQKHDCVYHTEVMPFTIAAEGISEKHGGGAGMPFRLELVYDLYVNGKKAFRNEMTVVASSIRQVKI